MMKKAQYAVVRTDRGKSYMGDTIISDDGNWVRIMGVDESPYDVLYFPTHRVTRVMYDMDKGDE